MILHPGAASVARPWPPDRWASVAHQLAAEGHRVVLTGSRGEVGLCRTVAKLARVRAGARVPAPTAAAGRTSLGELFASVAGARLVVAGDTSIAHVASAFATPSVVLFGPESPARWGPPGQGPHTALWKGRSGDPHGATVDPGLLAISADEVTAAARARLFGFVGAG